MSTHEVTNRAAPPCEYNVFKAHLVLCEGLLRWGREEDRVALEVLGRRAGSLEAQTWGDQADHHPPVLRTHSPQGARIDEVNFVCRGPRAAGQR